MTPKPFVITFEVGDQVELVHGRDIKGSVTGICLRQHGYCTYEVTWVHAGDKKTGWFEDFDLALVKKEK